MKRMNLVNVMNAIESENATMPMLLDKNAFWNKNSAIDMRNSYDDYVMETEWHNDCEWDYIEWCEKHDLDYSNCHIEKILPFAQWAQQYNNTMAKYMVA
jgi:hypothetical protein